MGVVKLTFSKNAVQFITDEDVIYQTSKVYLLSLMAGTLRSGVLKLSRMPFPAPRGRFPKSSIYGLDEKTNEYIAEQDERKNAKSVMDAALADRKKESKYVGDDEW